MPEGPMKPCNLKKSRSYRELFKKRKTEIACAMFDVILEGYNMSV